MIDVSVVIPAYNEEKSIEILLRNLVSGSLVPKEIIVVDGNSNDGTPGLVNDFILKNKKYNIKLIRLENITFPGRARNIGVKEA
jgi:glycosyltransferase involved in cell wall biosynthesis